MAKMIELRKIQPKDKVQFGCVLERSTKDDVNADIIPGKSIRIFGTTNCVTFDQTFELGDIAEHDYYNFAFTGAIEKITEKSVTVRKNRDTTKRLDIFQFIQKNYNFSVEAAAKQRAEWHD